MLSQRFVRIQLFGSIIAAALLWLAPAARAEPLLFNILDFRFEDGTVLPELRIAYKTQGTLAPAHDNAILLIPGASADRHAFDARGPTPAAVAQNLLESYR